MNVKISLRDTVDSGLWTAQKGTLCRLAFTTNAGCGVHVLAGLGMGRQPFSWPSKISSRL